jgi:hypothetical protein
LGDLVAEPALDGGVALKQRADDFTGRGVAAGGDELVHVPDPVGGQADGAFLGGSHEWGARRAAYI